jgi:hypothetical protein
MPTLPWGLARFYPTQAPKADGWDFLLYAEMVDQTGATWNQIASVLR